MNNFLVAFVVLYINLSSAVFKSVAPVFTPFKSDGKSQIEFLHSVNFHLQLKKNMSSDVSMVLATVQCSFS